MKKTVIILLVIIQSSTLLAQQTTKRMITPSDVLNMKSVRQPKVSPDGNWVLYSISRVDSVKDKNISKLFQVKKIKFVFFKYFIPLHETF